MKIGVTIGYSGSSFSVPPEELKEIESLGYDSVWTSEAYGSDALTPAAWALAHTERITVGTAIIQMGARTPTAAAMAAMTLQALSGDRFVLGIGPSGPQVIEGWYGVPYGKPLTRTREYIAIIRKILAREEALTHEGEHYTVPATGPGITGLGRPLKSILHAKPGLKIFTGAFTPAGVRTAAEIADGFFPVFMNPERFDLFEGPLNDGFAAAGGGKSLAGFEIAPFVPVHVGDDLDACRMEVKRHLALYVGGMGAREKNFYNDYAVRLGYPDAAAEVQDLFLGGKRKEAAAAIPDSLVDDVALVGAARADPRTPLGVEGRGGEGPCIDPDRQPLGRGGAPRAGRRGAVGTRDGADRRGRSRDPRSDRQVEIRLFRDRVSRPQTHGRQDAGRCGARPRPRLRGPRAGSRACPPRRASAATSRTVSPPSRRRWSALSIPRRSPARRPS